jgi:methylase of polypeptide subunit release factors
MRQQALAELDTQPADALFTRHDIQYPYECTFGAATLRIDEGVFCPTFTKASPLLLSTIDYRPDEYVLDAFSGSGAFGVNAALHGARVVAFDKSERAVKCVRGNAARNRVGDHVDVRHGTFGDTISPDEKFDLIIANPPLLPGEPESELGSAVFDPGLQATIDFIERLPAVLTANGRCYLLTSNVIERCGFNVDELCHRHKLKNSIVEQPDFGYEQYRVHRITLRRPKLGWLFASK